MKTIKVNLHYGEHSAGRGVGYYADNLAKALSDHKEITLTTTNPDIVHYPFFDLFYSTLPIIKKTKTIVTIHDLTPLVLKHLYPKGVKGSINLYRQWLSLQNVSAIITDSNNSKEDIVRLFHTASDKVFVTPLAADPIYSLDIPSGSLQIIKEKYQLPKNFVLTVAGGPNPNKNLPFLAEATRQLQIPLVIVGKGMLQTVSKPVHPELRDLINLKKYSHIIYLGFVPTEDLSAVYRLATLYCQPSLYEGFGLPVLEAMMSRCMLVSSHSSSLPEIYAKDTIAFDPNNMDNLIDALKYALSMDKKQKEEYISRQYKRSQNFTWSKTAMDTIKIYEIVSKK